MAYIKSSLLIFFILSSFAWGQERFSSKSCLDANFKMTMLHNGALFGLLKQEFVINKIGCIISVNYKRYFPKQWVIDVCREPVHIKVTSVTGVDVAKKTAHCSGKGTLNDTGDFCTQYLELMEIVQDEGLIFAEGDRDNLDSNHGKTYCSYLLIERYLKDSIVFSRYTDVPEIFIDSTKSKLTPAQPIQETRPKSETKADPVDEIKEKK